MFFSKALHVTGEFHCGGFISFFWGVYTFFICSPHYSCRLLETFLNTLNHDSEKFKWVEPGYPVQSKPYWTIIENDSVDLHLFESNYLSREGEHKRINMKPWTISSISGSKLLYQFSALTLSILMFDSTHYVLTMWSVYLTNIMLISCLLDLA